jgi:signal peptidase I
MEVVGSENLAQPKKMRKVRRWISIVLGFFIPGLGLLYLSRPRAAFGLAGVYFFSVAVVIVAGFYGVLPVIAAAFGVIVVTLLGLVITWRAFPLNQQVARRHPLWLGVYASLIVVTLGMNEVFLTLWPIKPLSHPSQSMRPALNVGDLTWAWRETLLKPLPSLRRGDIVAFWTTGFSKQDGFDCDFTSLSQGNPLLFVDRVIGLPGDTLSMQGNILTVNGLRVSNGASHPRIVGDGEWVGNIAVTEMKEKLPGAAGDYSIWIRDSGSPFGSFEPLTVPEGMLFVMGDYRDNSIDSRACGFVARDQVEGLLTHYYWRSGKFGISKVGRSLE